MEERGKPIDILLVEDNPGDVRLVQEVLKAGKIRNALSVVEDGVEAMSLLRREGAYSDAPRPRVVLLDLNLPRKGGMEVLAEVKGDESLKRIPVIVLTVSRAEKDIIESYGLHANAYVIKPIDFNQFTAAIKSIEGFWLSIVKLPPE